MVVYLELSKVSNHIHFVSVNITLSRELGVSFEPEDVADGEETDSSDLLPEEEEILNNTSTEDFLKRPGPEEQEKEKEEKRKEKEAFEEHEKRVQKIQVGTAQTEAETEQMRRFKEDLKRNAEINKKMAAQLEKNLKTEDITEVIQNEGFLDEVEKTSTRHQDFHSNSSKKKEKLQYRNFLHMLTTKQTADIRSHLKKRFKSHSDDYVDGVLMGETILRLYCRVHNLSREAAEEKLLNTGMDVDMDSEEEAAKLAREERQRKKKEEERKKVFKVFKEEEMKNKQKKTEEKEKQPKAEEKRVFKFKLENTQKKKTVEEERGKRDKMVSKKQKANTVKSTIEDRRAEEERRQKVEKGRLEDEKKKKAEVEEEKKEKEEDKRRREEEKEKMAEKISSMVKERWAEEKRRPRRRTETLEEERGKREKQKAKTVTSRIEDRGAEEERCRPRRIESGQPANLPLSESAILGRGDAVASVLVDDMLGIRSSRTHNP